MECTEAIRLIQLAAEPDGNTVPFYMQQDAEDHVEGCREEGCTIIALLLPDRGAHDLPVG